MPEDVIIEFMDGTAEGGKLPHQFDPDADKLEFQSEKAGKKRTVSFGDICILLLKKKPSRMSLPQHLDWLEEIITCTGKYYHVAVVEHQPHSAGFFAFSIGSFYRHIFFMYQGIRTRRQDRLIGDILKSQGSISDADLKTVLQEQEYLNTRRLGTVVAEQEVIPQERIEKSIQEASQGRRLATRVRIGDVLIDAGLVTREQVENALAIQTTGKKKKIGELLVHLGYITEEQLLNALAIKFRRRFVDLQEITPDRKTLEVLSKDIVKSLQVFPIEDRGTHIVVATSKPTDYSIEDSLRFHTQRRVEVVIATSSQIAEAIMTFYPEDDFEVQLKSIMGQLPDQVAFLEEEIEDASLSESDSQLISIVNKFLTDAYRKGASDIHIEPGAPRSPLTIRYRVDGICHVAFQIPETYKRAVISRLKIMSNLDISERRRPQSGKISMRYDNRKIEYRVEITPTGGGNEDAVLRIFGAAKPMPLQEMGFSAHNLEAFRGIITQPYGLILCVGPTGSGKTTTLHSALNYVNKPEIKIWTAEEPIEITQRGIRQVQIEPRIGFTFHDALRSFLRSDPDVIMIGEMRDEETSKTAIEASLTGHLVFSTLHTNNAPETIVRLIEMGMDPYNFADSLLGIVAQRLVRRFCPHCRIQYHPDTKTYDTLVELYDSNWYQEDALPPYSPDLTLWQAGSCSQCDNGFKGRMAIHELIVATPDIKKAIKERISIADLRNMAMLNGMRSLRMDGIRKVFQGHTDIDQVMKVCL